MARSREVLRIITRPSSGTVESVFTNRHDRGYNQRRTGSRRWAAYTRCLRCTYSHMPRRPTTGSHFHRCSFTACRPPPPREPLRLPIPSTEYASSTASESIERLERATLANKSFSVYSTMWLGAQRSLVR